MKVLLHVNYLEGDGDKLAQLFRLAADNGCDGVELRWKYRFADRSQAEYRETVVRLRNEYPDFELVFGGIIDFCRGEAEQVKRDLDDYLGFLGWAKEKCGGRVMNFFTGVLTDPTCAYHEFDRNGSAVATDGDFERSAAGLRTVGDRAQELGIAIALETHNAYLHDLAEPCAKLMELTRHPAVGLNYDHGNIYLNRNGGSVDDFFAVAGDYVRYAHLKNAHKVAGVNGGGYLITRLEEGGIDQYRVMELLKQHLKGDLIAIEYPSTGDGRIAARRDMAYIRELKAMLDIR